MNEKTKSINTQTQGAAAPTELLFRPATLVAAVVVGAMDTPKFPPFVGD